LLSLSFLQNYGDRELAMMHYFMLLVGQVEKSFDVVLFACGTGWKNNVFDIVLFHLQVLLLFTITCTNATMPYS